MKSSIVRGSIGKMNAVFHPWPIREFRDRRDGIPESGVQGRFSSAHEFKHGGLSYRAGHAVAPSTPVQDFRLQFPPGSIISPPFSASMRSAAVRGFSPPEMALPNHPDVF